MELVDRVRVNQAKAAELSEVLDESTSLSWLWAFLLGPLYFAFHGFWGRAALVFGLNFVIIGFVIAPFLSYPAWKNKAKEKAERALLLDAAQNSQR